MGRDNLSKIQHNSYINRRNHWQSLSFLINNINTIISYYFPLLWSISSINYQFSNNILIITITTTTGTIAALMKTPSCKDSTTTSSSFIMKLKPLWLMKQSLITLLQSYGYNIIIRFNTICPYNDPTILANTISSYPSLLLRCRLHTSSIQSIKQNTRPASIRPTVNGLWQSARTEYFSTIINMLRNRPTQTNMTLTERKIEKPSIQGIRILINGINGKMTECNHIILNYGTLQFNNTNSIIYYGQSRNNNNKGIISVKVWISYSAL
jgi:hypothetical protein